MWNIQKFGHVNSCELYAARERERKRAERAARAGEGRGLDLVARSDGGAAHL